MDGYTEIPLYGRTRSLLIKRSTLRTLASRNAWNLCSSMRHAWRGSKEMNQGTSTAPGSTLIIGLVWINALLLSCSRNWSNPGGPLVFVIYIPGCLYNSGLGLMFARTLLVVFYLERVAAFEFLVGIKREMDFLILETRIAPSLSTRSNLLRMRWWVHLFLTSLWFLSVVFVCRVLSAVAENQLKH